MEIKEKDRKKYTTLNIFTIIFGTFFLVIILPYTLQLIYPINLSSFVLPYAIFIGIVMSISIITFPHQVEISSEGIQVNYVWKKVEISWKSIRDIETEKRLFLLDTILYVKWKNQNGIKTYKKVGLGILGKNLRELLMQAYQNYKNKNIG